MNCSKIKYKDKISAMFALASCKHSKKGKRQERRIYYCNICKCYHLTSKSKLYGNENRWRFNENSEFL
jgi:hypothetical protein